MRQDLVSAMPSAHAAGDEPIWQRCQEIWHWDAFEDVHQYGPLRAEYLARNPST
jgi:hypothetical protein